jgi:hypothetical protein
MAGKRQFKKNPFLVVYRYLDWPHGHYAVLPSDPFDTTAAAKAAKKKLLEENGVDIAQIVKEHGGLRVGVAQFTDISDFGPTIGYEEKNVDSMEVVPLVAGDPLSQPPQDPQPGAEVDIKPEEASEPPPAEEPAEEPAAPPVDPPPSEEPDSGPPTGSDPEPPPPPPADPAAPAEGGEGQGDGFWSDMESESPSSEGPPAASVSSPPPPPPQEGGTADDLLV